MASAETSLPAAGGYPTDIIIGDYDNKFVCNDCKGILKAPVQSFCGHRFCEACIQSVIRSGKEIKCGICVSEGVEDDYSIIQGDQMFPDNAVKREMAKLKVRCVYFKDGCSWAGNFKDLEVSHLKDCPYQPEPCPNCGAAVAMVNKENHNKNECPRRLLQCKHCKMDFCFQEMDEHSKLCQKYPLKCDSCNKKKIPRDRMQIHQEQECQNQKVTCPVGCGTMERAKIPVHFSENMPLHFAWILDSIRTLRLQTSEGQTERDSRIATLEARVTDIINHGLTTSQAPSDDMTPLIQGQITPLVNKTQTLDANVSTFEGIVWTLHREIDKIITHLERFERYKEEAKQTEEELKRKIISLERTLAMKDIALTEEELKQKIISDSYLTHFAWILQEMDSIRRMHMSEGQPERDSRMATLEAQVTNIINHLLTSSQVPSDDITQLIQGQVTQLVNNTHTSYAKISSLEVIVSTLHHELVKMYTVLKRLEKNEEEAKQNEDLRIQSLDFASYTGAYVWKISDFSQKQQDASKGQSISIYSPAFYTSRLGYKMCACLYPNGDGMGKGKHMSLFFVVMRVHYDALLTWPFKQRVTFMLVNQIGGDHVLDSFRPDPSSSSFRRPTSDMNIASGNPLFISSETVRNPGSGFLKDDCMYIKISVDTANLEEPLINDRRVSVET